MRSLDEALVICDAAREVCDLPLMISFSCEGDGKLYFGGTVAEAAASLEAMGVDAVGVNCSVGPDQLEGWKDRLEDVAAHVCDKLCRHPMEVAEQEELDAICEGCPVSACAGTLLDG